MAGSVTFDALGESQSLRLTFRAGQKVEQLTGIPFGKLASKLGESVGFQFSIAFFSACLADGKGVKTNDALDILDDIGLGRATELIVETINASDVGGEEGDSGNGKTGKS